jgi:hypothetical protein
VIERGREGGGEEGAIGLTWYELDKVLLIQFLENFKDWWSNKVSNNKNDNKQENNSNNNG